MNHAEKQWYSYVIIIDNLDKNYGKSAIREIGLLLLPNNKPRSSCSR